MQKVYLGIDTSCYTTSVALVNEEGEVISDARQVLSVKKGRQGLSQSEMVYQHTRNLPNLFERCNFLTECKLAGIGVSSRPRRKLGSYMPAFLPGITVAKAIATATKTPLCEFTHQENHVFAAVRDYPEIWGKPMYVMHLSGGTTDILEVEWNTDTLNITTIGESQDISAGQLIDRVGVLLGCSFPCGPEIEKLAKPLCYSTVNYRLPLSRNPQIITFSGAETQIKLDLKRDELNSGEVAQAVLDLIYRTIKRFLLRQNLIPGRPFIAVGGVMANQYLRERISLELQKMNLLPYMATVKYSSDNATGNAFGASKVLSVLNGNKKTFK